MNEINEMMDKAYWFAMESNWDEEFQLQAMSVYAQLLETKARLMELNK